MKNKYGLMLTISFLINISLSAQNHILLQDAFSAGGGKSTSSSFILHHITGQSATGRSTSGSFIEYGGMLFHVSAISGIIMDKMEIPDEFFLSPIFPNPMLGSTTIEYGIPENAFVNIQIYDLMGRRARVLVRNLHKPGVYRKSWNGRDNYGKVLPAGIYFLRLSTPEFQKCRKVFKIK